MPSQMDGDLAAAYRAAGLWSRDETLATLLAGHVRLRGDALAVVDSTGARLTYEELGARARSLAAGLASLGIGRGAVVGVQLPNVAGASVVHCAVDILGAIAVPLVTMYRDLELRHIVAVTGMQALFLPGAHRGYDHDALGLALRRESPSLILVSSSAAPAPGIESLDELSTGVSPTDPKWANGPRAPDEPAAILFTSGTEATPKAVVHTNNTLLVNTRSLTSMLKMGPGDAVFMASPVGHGTGLGFGIRFAVQLGSKLVLQDVWDAAKAAETIAQERCTYTHASTTFAQDLLTVAEESPRAATLRYFVSGGASVPPGFARRMRNAMGCTLLRLYGQTEAFMTTINRPDDQLERLDGFDGRAAPGVEVEIRGEDGASVPPGQTGELTCRGPHRCVGFLNDPRREAATFDPAGWMRMGDLGIRDDEGYVQVVGRVKEVISRGGYKYSPREVEELLLDHPSVSRAAVVKMPDPRLGERACAFVTVEGDATLALADVVEFLRGRGLAPFKLPERLEVVERLPTTASGKVQKFELERMLSEQSA